MTCSSKQKNKKTATNNQWAGTGASGTTCGYQEKTEFSNEWVSTNKMATEDDANKRTK